MQRAPTSASSSVATSVLALTAILLVTGFVVAGSFASVSYHPQVDEGMYRSYMEHIARRGPAGFPELFQSYVTDEKRWILPSPLRIGFIGIAAAWGKLFGTTFVALSWLSLASHLAFVSITWFFALRHWGARRANALALLTASSCLCLGIARLALLDSLSTLCAGVVVWTYVEHLGDVRNLRWLAAFVLALTLAILVKEANVLLVGPCLGLLVWTRWVRREPIPLARCILVLAAPFMLAGVAWIAAAGGVTPVLETVRVVRASLAQNEYAHRFMSGPWYRYAIDHMLLSPWTTILGLFGIGAFVVRPTGDRAEASWILVLALVVLEYSFVEKDARYLMFLEMPLRLGALLFIDGVSARLPRAWASAVFFGALGLIAWSEYESFRTLFVDGKVYDPITRVLGYLRGLLPVDGR